MTSFTPDDDEFHFAQMGDRWWMTETSWFSFCKPEEKLGGWIYVMVRPNIGTVAGGAWIWDDSAHLPWEVLYNANYTALRLPEGARLSDIALPTGVSIRALEPTMRYALGVEDGEHVHLSLEFAGIMPPRPLRHAGSAFGSNTHFDQFGRVRGTIQLPGREVAIDCLAMRDRSWGPRPEHRPRRSAYVTGIASEREGFLAVTGWKDGVERITYGFLLRDGEIADLAGGTRQVVRDPTHGWVTEITIDATDERGRTLHAEGQRMSGLIINRHSFIDSNGLIEWSIDGHQGHGEDQDMWPIHEWRSAASQRRVA